MYIILKVPTTENPAGTEIAAPVSRLSFFREAAWQHESPPQQLAAHKVRLLTEMVDHVVTANHRTPAPGFLKALVDQSHSKNYIMSIH